MTINEYYNNKKIIDALDNKVKSLAMYTSQTESIENTIERIRRVVKHKLKLLEKNIEYDNRFKKLDKTNQQLLNAIYNKGLSYNDISNDVNENHKLRKRVSRLCKMLELEVKNEKNTSRESN